MSRIHPQPVREVPFDHYVPLFESRRARTRGSRGTRPPHAVDTDTCDSGAGAHRSLGTLPHAARTTTPYHLTRGADFNSAERIRSETILFSAHQVVGETGIEALVSVIHSLLAARERKDGRSRKHGARRGVSNCTMSTA